MFLSMFSRTELSIQVYPVKQEGKEVQEELKRFFKKVHRAEARVTEALCVDSEDYKLKTMNGLECLSIAVKVRAFEPLRQLWNSFVQKNMTKKLRGLFPSEVDKVFISEDDYRDGCRFFEATRGLLYFKS